MKLLATHAFNCIVLMVKFGWTSYEDIPLALVSRLFLLWLVSEACQMSMSAWVVIKWFHLPLDKQTTGCNSPHDWLMILTMDLAALCDMRRWKWYQWMPFGCFWLRPILWPSLCGCPPTPILQPYRSANSISYSSKNLVGNSASYSLDSWWIDKL